MHDLNELKEKLMRELEAYSANGKYSKEDVEVIKYIASAVDHLCNIMEEDEEEYSSFEGSSRASYAQGGNRGGGGRGGNRGGGQSSRGSYARGQRRNRMGRYSREGYSRAEDEMIESLRELMEDAPDDRTRQEFQRLISKLEQMG